MLERLLAKAYRRKVRGAGRVAIRLTGRTLLPSIETETIAGLHLFADPTSYVDQEILRVGSFEPEVLRTIMELIGNDGVFWDVGANTGIHALTVKHLLPSVKVFAFEPSPPCFTRLIANARRNGLDISAWCIALADRSGTSRCGLSTKGTQVSVR